MSTPCTRLLCVPGVAAASRRTLSNRSPRGLLEFTRCQSTKKTNPTGGFRAGRFAGYTLTTVGLALGGALVYANYDPVFKNQANKIVPGFAQLVDTVADLFVDRVSSGRSRGGTASDSSAAGGVRVIGSEVKRGSVDESAVQSPTGHDTQPISQTKAEDNETRDIQPQPSETSAEAAPILEHSEAKTENKETGLDVEDVKGDGGKGEGVVEEVESQNLKGGVVEGVKEHVKGEGVGEKVRSDVERAVDEVKGEVDRVAGEVREEKVRELQEAQMADQQLGWLKDSAQVEKKLEQTLQDFFSQAARLEEAQNNMLTHSQEHSRLLKRVASGTPEELKDIYDTADAVHKAGVAVQESHEAMNSAMDDYRALLNSLIELMDRATELGLRSKVEEVDEKVRECKGKVVEGFGPVKQAEIERELLQDYWKQTQLDREQLQRELSKELPEAGSLKEAVVVMLARRVDILKMKLEDAERVHQERLAAALEKQQEGLLETRDRIVDWKVKEKEQELQQDFRYQMDKVYREHQSELREELKRQTDSHNYLLTDALNTQAEQLEAKWSGELELKLIEQENHYHRELALVLSQLRGIEYMINTISAAGHETKRQQGMRAACDSLHMALNSASASPDPIERRSLQQEVKVLRDAAKDDPFILVVLDSLPDRAVSASGIQGEGGLMERFSKVKRICRRVALVPERGGGMGTYALSYLQSLLVVSWRFVGRLTRDSEDYEDLKKLDTFDILEQAEACLQCGDIELAVRYVNLLRGEPRNVAQDWLSDARSYLETLQAVQLVSEYMAALNITSSSGPNAVQADK